jgi:hypothetical protein
MSTLTKPDNVLRLEAMDILIKALGLIDAQRFIASVQSERFDYTDWRSNLWEDRSLEEIHYVAAEYFEKTHPNGIPEEKRLPKQC